MLYEMRKKALLDEQSALDYAESRGRVEGKAERDKEIAASMLKKGLSVSLIAEVTGLSEAEIETLNNQLH
jgi:predicted transposase/invertase (TIGR01784 family)